MPRHTRRTQRENRRNIAIAALMTGSTTLGGCGGPGDAAIAPEAGRARRDPTGIASPTGHDPNYLWTPEQQAVWARMVAEDHPWWRIVREAAGATDTPNQWYGDLGQWAALAYQMTGDATYAQKAWSQIEWAASLATTMDA